MPQRIIFAVWMMFLAAFISSSAAFAQVWAVADIYATAMDSMLVVSAPGVLENDESTDSLAARRVTGPFHGDAVLHSDGSFEYTPSVGYEGRDSLTYVAQILKPIRFTVDSAATILTLDAELESEVVSATDQVSSPVRGRVTAYLLPGVPPYEEVHLVEIELTFIQNLHLEFSTLFGSLLADVAPGNMMISMLESGGPVSASGTAFYQPGNLAQLTATAVLEGTGFLSSQVPAGNQDIIVDEVLALEGDIQLTADEDALHLELPIDFAGAFSVSTAEVNVQVTGTVYASAVHDPPAESAETVVSIDVGTVGTQKEDAELPSLTALYPLYPNPFNSQTVVRYELKAASELRMSVFDVTGREVRVLAVGGHSAGTHEVVFDAAGLPGGVYFVRLVSGDALEVRRAVLAK